MPFSWCLSCLIVSISPESFSFRTGAFRLLDAARREFVYPLVSDFLDARVLGLVHQYLEVNRFACNRSIWRSTEENVKSDVVKGY